MKYQCVIWDWNGTLADDVQASLQATNAILAKRNRPPITLEQYYSYIDTPISRFYEHLFDLNEVSMEVIGAEFYSFYPRYFEGLHSGAVELLRTLHGSGIRQVILSSGHRDNVERDMARLGILPYFDEILAADDLLAESKKARGLHWIQTQDSAPSQMVMIGDTLHDYATARAMGIDCILCAIGHQSEADLLTAGVPVVHGYDQLARLLAGSG